MWKCLILWYCFNNPFDIIRNSYVHIWVPFGWTSGPKWSDADQNPWPIFVKSTIQRTSRITWKKKNKNKFNQPSENAFSITFHFKWNQKRKTTHRHIGLMHAQMTDWFSISSKKIEIFFLFLLKFWAFIYLHTCHLCHSKPPHTSVPRVC